MFHKTGNKSLAGKRGTDRQTDRPDSGMHRPLSNMTEQPCKQPYRWSFVAGSQDGHPLPPAAERCDIHRFLVMRRWQVVTWLGWPNSFLFLFRPLSSPHPPSRSSFFFPIRTSEGFPRKKRVGSKNQRAGRQHKKPRNLDRKRDCLLPSPRFKCLNDDLRLNGKISRRRRGYPPHHPIGWQAGRGGTSHPILAHPTGCYSRPC